MARVDHFQTIYANDSARYQQLIAAEDVDHNLLRTLRALAPLQDAVLVDVGTGTGRIPRLLAPFTRNIWGLDAHAAMLRENVNQRASSAGEWALCRGDARELPFASQSADVVTAAWCLGHFTAWYADSWRSEASRALDEMRRVLKPDGRLILIETLSTGTYVPVPPTPGLAAFYDWLAQARGMYCTCISTDYQFATPEEAAQKLEFFFGDVLSERILERRWSRVPEWTGVWTQRRSTSEKRSK